MIPVIIFSGYSNSGKTTILEAIIEYMRKKDLEVAVIKHHRGSFDLGGYGKDSSKYSKSGAKEIYLISESHQISIKKHEEEPSLEEIIEKIDKVDIILVEGYKECTKYPKIEIFRKELGAKRINSKNIIAIISDNNLEESKPVFKFFEIEKICDFILKYIIKNKMREV